MSLTLTREQERLIQAQIATGNFETPAQVIDAALDLLELGEAASPAYKLGPEAIRASVIEGLAQAKNGTFAPDEEVQALLTTRTDASSQ